MTSDPMDNRELIAAAETHCLAQNSDGLVCSEEPGHDGWHRAYLSDEDRLLDTWPTEEL